MLPKNKRVPRKLFDIILKSREYSNSKHFILRSAPASGTRVAVSVSKKVSKKAVVRNKIRRRAYASIAHLIIHLPHKFYLLSAKLGADKIKGPELDTELAHLFKKS